MTFFDLCIGARMHLAFYVLCGLFDDFLFGFYDFLFCLLYSLMYLMDLLFYSCFINRFVFIRLRGLSYILIYDILLNSLSGLFTRSCGLV